MIFLGNCLDVMKTLENNSVDAMVTDPPYGWSFMGKTWDYDIPGVETWRECFRVLKPGAHALVACGTRTQHRMACALEDAGFEIRDVVLWLHGNGFPKSLNVSKAIDKKFGAIRPIIGKIAQPCSTITATVAFNGSFQTSPDLTAPATDAVKQWDGWGSTLKPACEFWTLCRKPLSEKTIFNNVLKWGTGAINIDGARISTTEFIGCRSKANAGKPQCDGTHGDWGLKTRLSDGNALGRFPANVVLDGEAGQMLDAQTSNLKRGASRFFYCPKVCPSERGDCKHPTMKPLSLMRYLCKLITPPGGLVLDPFTGSGSTGVAAIQEGFQFIGCEQDEESFEFAFNRIKSTKSCVKE